MDTTQGQSDFFDNVSVYFDQLSRGAPTKSIWLTQASKNPWRLHTTRFARYGNRIPAFRICGGRSFASKVRRRAWIGSVPPAVAGGYVIDTLDLLMFCEPDPLPTRYGRWY